MAGYEPTDLRGQERDKAEAREKKRVAKDQEDKDLLWLMGSRPGRRFVWRLLEYARVFESSFNTNSMQMAFNEGRKVYGTTLFASIQAVCPGLYERMVQEVTNGRNDDGTADHSN